MKFQGTHTIFQLFAFQVLFSLVFTNTHHLKCHHKPPHINEDTDGVCGEIPTSPCLDSCYRSLSGLCNNLRHPSLGTPNSTYGRLLPAKYGDNHSSPQVSVSGNPLPNARKVSFTIYPDSAVPIQNQRYTLNSMQYGQFITHDMSLTAISFNTSVCCTSDRQLISDPPGECFSIPVPSDDPAYAPQNISCLPMLKTSTDKDNGCIGNRSKVEQLNSVTSFLDLSHIYGNSEATSNELRTFNGGQMRSQVKNGQILWPTAPNSFSYLSGDIRANQNIQLQILHTLYLREHNRIARELEILNSHWNDECLFQEARKINIAQHQYISYYEWLPMIISKNLLVKNKILFDTVGYVDDYDPKSSPLILNEHATAAFRFFHTAIAGNLMRANENRNITGSVRISDYWNTPWLLLDDKDAFSELTRGLCTQHELEADEYYDSQITLEWLKTNFHTKLGEDLKAICIQRGRDHGLASYNDLRELSGLPRAQKFSDLLTDMSPKNVERLQSLYEHPDDIDMTVGGALENLVPGNLAGTTYLYVLLKQFKQSRTADRFFFENCGKTGFTLPQLGEIRKASFSGLVCNNNNNLILQMQPNAFLGISPSNDLVSCHSDKIKKINLSLWKDPHKQPCCSRTVACAKYK